jgi:hypothetical protein
MVMKQTAVEWLVAQLNKQGFAPVVTEEEIQIALKMEKEQIEDAYDTGIWDVGCRNSDSKRYYNETFNTTNK